MRRLRNTERKERRLREPHPPTAARPARPTFFRKLRFRFMILRMCKFMKVTDSDHEICPCGTAWTECAVHFSAVPVGLVRRPSVKRHTIHPMDLPTAHAKLRRIDSGTIDNALHFTPGPQLQARLQHIQSQTTAAFSPATPQVGQPHVNTGEDIARDEWDIARDE